MYSLNADINYLHSNIHNVHIIYKPTKWILIMFQELCKQNSSVEIHWDS
jgi:hypothetical protein